LVESQNTARLAEQLGTRSEKFQRINCSTNSSLRRAIESPGNTLDCIGR